MKPDIGTARFVLDHQAGVATTSTASAASLPIKPLWRRITRRVIANAQPAPVSGHHALNGSEGTCLVRPSGAAVSARFLLITDVQPVLGVRRPQGVPANHSTIARSRARL